MSDFFDDIGDAKIVEKEKVYIFTEDPTSAKPILFDFRARGSQAIIVDSRWFGKADVQYVDRIVFLGCSSRDAIVSLYRKAYGHSVQIEDIVTGVFGEALELPKPSILNVSETILGFDMGDPFAGEVSGSIADVPELIQVEPAISAPEIVDELSEVEAVDEDEDEPVNDFAIPELPVRRGRPKKGE